MNKKKTELTDNSNALMIVGLKQVYSAIFIKKSSTTRLSKFCQLKERYFDLYAKSYYAEQPKKNGEMVFLVFFITVKNI